MAQTVNLRVVKSAQVFEATPTTNLHAQNVYTQYPNPAAGTATKVLLKFGAPGSPYRYRPIQSGAAIKVTYTRSSSATKPFFWVKLCDSDFKDFDEETINWNSTPGYSAWSNIGSSVSWGTTSGNEKSLSLPSGYVNAENAARLAREPVFLFPIDTSAPSSANVAFSTAENDLYLQVTVGNTDVTGIVKALSPISGTINRSVPQTFRWEFVPQNNELVFGDWTQTSATFRWRSPGGAWNSIHLTTEQQVTIPANTFPAGNIEWQVYATNNVGIASTSATSTIATSADPVAATPSSPVGGYYINETRANLFVWTASGPQTKADLQWSQDGSTWADLATVNSSALQYSVPANTFPGQKTLYWRVRSYNTDNAAGPWSSAASFSTTDTQPIATPLSPADSIEDGSKEIAFEWSVTNASGEPQSSSELQYSVDAINWNALGTAQGTAVRFDVTPGSLAAGKVYWRVRSSNRQGAFGPWSASASFQCMAAPPAPNLSVTPVPFAIISWQSVGQQAYRVTIDGTVYGPFWGGANEFASPVFLQDGEHTASVEVQGIYGFWSDPGEISFSVQNNPGDPIELNITPSIDALLEWRSTGDYDSFTVYRDGNPIAKTEVSVFTDRFVLGYHSYYVVHQLADGNYSKSNTVSVELTVDMSYIAAASSGAWLPLRLSENSASAQNFTFSRSCSLRHVTGATYPVAEIAQFQDLSGSYDVAFTDLTSAKAFEALFGQLVIVKSRGNSVVIGPLVTLNKTHNDFYINYSFTVQQIEWEDYVNAADSGV